MSVKENADGSLGDGEYHFKFVLVGQAEAGKTSLIFRFGNNVFPAPREIGEAPLRRILNGSKYNITIDVWDTQSQEKFKMITRSLYRHARGILLVFDIANVESFQQLNTWYDEVIRYEMKDIRVAKMVIGNKLDLQSSRVVSTTAAKEWADKMGLRYMETSALSGENVDTAFRALAEEIVEVSKSPIYDSIIVREEKT